jgi:hypothetical protein
MKKILTALLAAFMAFAAYATITFTASSGQGFVGKGDVQLVLGMNNAQIQTAISQGKIRFQVIETHNYEAVCMFVTGEGTPGQKTHLVSQSKTSDVNQTVAYDARQRNQYTGFNLLGYGASAWSGSALPEVGGGCLGEGVNGTYSSVTEFGFSTDLFVVYDNGAPLRLNWPVPVV